MKKVIKTLRRLIKNLLKDKWNIAIMILVLLVIILGVMVVGVKKTLIIMGIVIALMVAIKYGSTFIKGKKKKSDRHETKHRKKHKKLLNIAVLSVLCLGIIGVLGGIAFMGYIAVSAPKFDKQKLYYKEASIIYDINGKEITRMGNELRDKVTYDEIPQVFIDAIIATEDSRFFEHNGFDLPRFLKASAGQALGKSGAGGASTISMQVIKNNFTSTTQSITRKFTDIYLSVFKLEKEYTKQQILEFYVNDIHLGVNNTLGIAEAARGLFGKEIGDINISEAALLAGMFQAPGAYNPYKYPEKAATRRNTVLYLMERHGYITSEERAIANSIPIEELVIPQSSTGHPYQGYIDYVAEEVEIKTGYDPMEVPMKIYTNLNTSKQDHLNDILNSKTYTFENELVQAGIAVTDIHTGAIVALGGGRDRTAAKMFNLATDIKRQIGSTAKPIFDYGPGMEYNNWSTYTPFVDDIYSYSDGKNLNNWDNKYLGMLMLKDALGKSRNVPALKAFQQLDNKQVIEFAQSLGITPEIENDRIHEAHAIGGFNGASPLQLAVAYSAFANGGYYIEPYSVNKIEIIESGEVTKYQPEKVRVMSDSTAYMITSALKYAVDNKLVGGGRIDGVDVAAKSGTSNFDQITKDRFHLPSNAINDLWYAGFSTDYAIGMWYGYEKISSTYYSKSPSTSGVRDKLFTAVAKGIFENNGKKFEMPSSVVQVQVEKDSIPAMLPSAYTPSSMITVEYFKKGTEPTEVSPRFNTLPTVTGLVLTEEGSSVNLTWEAAKAPNMITDEYLFTISAQKEKYLNIRENADRSMLGILGYNVYVKNSNGELTLLGWTASTSYRHTPTTSGSLSYVVKACYSIFKSSEGAGATATLSESPYGPIIEMYLNDDKLDNKTINIKQNTPYTMPNVVVLENMVNVTSSADVDTEIKRGETVVSKVDTSIIGTYKVTYTVTYNGEIQSFTRTIIVTA